MVRRVAIEAGEITLPYFEMLFTADVQSKQDGSPVTQADHEAESYIQNALKEILPDVPFIGEESFALGNAPDIKGADYFWLVDPIDGTKEFLSGGPDFTVNIALIRNHEPILGVIYAPARGVLYAGYGGDTAIRWSAETDNDKPIQVRRAPNAGLTVLSSMRHGAPEKLDGFLSDFKIEKILKRASSLKICLIAEGKADIYPRLGPTCEWDTAAGDAILRAAGGAITDLQGNALRYGLNTRPDFSNPEFVASAFEWFDKEEARA